MFGLHLSYCSGHFFLPQHLWPLHVMNLVHCADPSQFFFDDTTMNECGLLHDVSEKHFHSTDFHRSDYTTMLDNSAIARVIGDEQLFINVVKT